MRKYREKFDVTGFNHEQLDLANQNQIQDKLSPLEFDLLINCAAMTDVDLCEQEIEQAFAINAEGPQLLARICRDKNAQVIHFSTDYVFGGEKRELYVENNAAKPISSFGELKHNGKQ